jgi:hypothetical protein
METIKSKNYINSLNENFMFNENISFNDITNIITFCWFSQQRILISEQQLKNLIRLPFEKRLSEPLYSEMYSEIKTTLKLPIKKKIRQFKKGKIDIAELSVFVVDYFNNLNNLLFELHKSNSINTIKLFNLLKK